MAQMAQNITFSLYEPLQLVGKQVFIEENEIQLVKILFKMLEI